MPIRFRCTHCHRLLGIATRKAGTDTACPHCGHTITVPSPPADDGLTERLNLEDVDELRGDGLTERVAPPATQVVPPAPVPAPVAKAAGAGRAPRPAPPPLPKAPDRASDEPPLFEGDMDAILGKTAAPVGDDRPRPAPTSGQDALSLGDPPQVLVLSVTTATLLLGCVVVLLAVAFAAGYYAAPRG